MIPSTSLASFALLGSTNCVSEDLAENKRHIPGFRITVKVKSCLEFYLLHYLRLLTEYFVQWQVHSLSVPNLLH